MINSGLRICIYQNKILFVLSDLNILFSELSIKMLANSNNIVVLIEGPSFSKENIFSKQKSFNLYKYQINQ